MTSDAPPGGRVAVLAVLAVIASAVAFVPAAVAPDMDAAAAPAQAAPPAGQPLTGDFDGDGRVDIFWYGPGSAPDHHWYGQSNLQFGGRPIAINRTYQPIIGDFDGDRRSDIFWYAPGSASDIIYYGTSSHGFAGKGTPVQGTYLPFTGDFNGDGRADIFWYAPGSGTDSVWYGAPGRTFVHRGFTVNRTLTPLVGDYNGDFRHDIFWYGTGSVADSIWYGTSTRSFAGKTTNVRGTYQPLVGDFDGDWRSDIFWYAPGSAGDPLWYGTSSRTFTGKTFTVNRTLVPRVGDYDGDGRRDIFWYAAGSDTDSIWYGTSTRSFAGRSANAVGPYQPVTGDFNGGGRTDVFWWAPGTGDDAVWFATASRGFSGRPTTIDLAYERPTPLQPQSLVDAYNPYGYIAHAAGGYDGRTYTNSLDAFEFNYARGFRVFELDFVVLGDGTVLAAHNGLESYYGLTKPFDQASWAEIAGNKFDGRYTIMRSNEVVQLLRDHPDAYVILDTKYQHDHIFRRFVSQTGGAHALMDRVLPHIKDQAELDLYRNTWPLRNYMIALYRTQASNRYDDPEAVQFIRNNRSPGVMMWWRDRDPALSLSQNHVQGRRFTPTFAGQVQAAGAIATVHTISDPADVPPFESLAIGVYSDAPFAVSGQRAAEEQPLVDPVFPPGVVPV
jgi:hypothetical protein